jgi:hypothetical protein
VDQIEPGLTSGQFRLGDDQLPMQAGKLLLVEADAVVLGEVVLGAVLRDRLLRGLELVAQSLDPRPQPGGLRQGSATVKARSRPMRSPGASSASSRSPSACTTRAA